MDIQKQVSLADKNWFRTGGNAEYYCEPASIQDYKKAIKFAKDNELDIYFLGDGANVLISDEGVEGIVVHPVNNDIGIYDNEFIRAGAGVKNSQLIKFALENNLKGLEEFSGIPGTVGGSVYINIHFFGSFLADCFVLGKVIDGETGEVIEVEKDWFEFGYDDSKLIEKRHYLYEAVFKLREVEDIRVAYLKGKSDEIIRQRNARYPMARTCGSFFKNFDKSQINFEIFGQKIIAVAYYLDRLGIKGKLRSAKAGVSFQHANMIVTEEGATTKDIVNLGRRMQKMVQEEFGLLPQPECQMIGFTDYPFVKE